MTVYLYSQVGEKGQVAKFKSQLNVGAETISMGVILISTAATPTQLVHWSVVLRGRYSGTGLKACTSARCGNVA